jgi:DNA-binding transcriptional LysR family regulator
VRDLNDLYLFVQIVRCGGFSAASRALRVPKSRLSRRIAALEDYLKMRLVQRSERAFSVTPAGTLFYRHCLDVIERAQVAENALAEMRGKPRGNVRVSCPITMAQYVLAPILPRFLAENEEVEVDVSFTNRSVNVVEAPFDVALFIHRAPLQSKSVVARAIGRSPQILVAGHKFFEKWPRPQAPQDLPVLPSLSAGRGTGSDEWELIGPDHVKSAVSVTPRLVSESLVILKEAAIGSVGIVRLPTLICQEELAAGRLERVLPSWSMPSHEIHLLYPTRKGMTPAIRAFVEYVIRAAAERLGQG